MRYKFMVNGVAYKVRYANGSYLPDISKSGYAYLAVYYDNNLMATGEQITVDRSRLTVPYIQLPTALPSLYAARQARAKCCP